MSILGRLTRTVTVLRAAADVDRYGNTVADWTAATSTTVAGWYAQASAAELLAGRDGQIDHAIVYLPAGTDVTGSDRIRIDGTTFDIVGPPNRAHGRNGEHHVELNVKVVTG